MGQFIGVSIGVFLVTILLLVVILLVAKKYLSPSGNVNIQINGDTTINVPQGSSLMTTLNENGIFLPSACGGKASCGQCKVQVLEGGGEILDSEKPHFTRKEIKDNWRLGCQCKVKSDMKIHVDESILGVKEYECTVISNKNVATFIKEFKVQLPAGAHMDFLPGSYAQIKIPAFDCIDYDKDFDKSLIGDEYLPSWEKFKMFDLKCKNPVDTIRAYSMANYPAEGDVFMLTVRIATPPFKPDRSGFMEVNPGIASSYIFSLKPGDKVIMSGPYGDFHPHFDTKREMIWVGGGAGMAPLRALPLPPCTRPSGPGSRCRRREVHRWLRSSGYVQHLPERPRGSRGHRVLYVRSWSNVKGSRRYARLAWRRTRKHHVRQLRRIVIIHRFDFIQGGHPSRVASFFCCISSLQSFATTAVNFLQQLRSFVTEPLEQCSKAPGTMLHSSWSNLPRPPRKTHIVAVSN